MSDDQRAASLTQLGTTTKYIYDMPTPELLERFSNPQSDKNDEFEIEIVAPEFTSLCPKTGQPDFATIVIKYSPARWCVESKSLKLYLGSFRQHGEFHESCVNRILNDLVNLLDPRWLSVEGQFTPRGGIKFWPVAEYRHPTLA